MKMIRAIVATPIAVIGIGVMLLGLVIAVIAEKVIEFAGWIAK